MSISSREHTDESDRVPVKTVRALPHAHPSGLARPLYRGWMRTSAIVLAWVLASVGCFSTAPFDAAHRQRVAVIHARYETELEREQRHHAGLALELAHRRAALAARPSPDPAALRALDDEAQALAARHAQVDRALARVHQHELDASTDQRAAQIDAARAVRRARVRAAAIAANDPGKRSTALPLPRWVPTPCTRDCDPTAAPTLDAAMPANVTACPANEPTRP